MSSFPFRVFLAHAVQMVYPARKVNAVLWVLVGRKDPLVGRANKVLKVSWDLEDLQENQQRKEIQDLQVHRASTVLME